MTAEWGELQITKDENGISQEETEGTKGRYDRRTLNVEGGKACGKSTKGEGKCGTINEKAAKSVSQEHTEGTENTEGRQERHTLNVERRTGG